MKEKEMINLYLKENFLMISVHLISKRSKIAVIDFNSNNQPKLKTQNCCLKK